MLWERAPQWEWARERLEQLRELDVRPIVGLVHHGSGPRDTSLLDPAFPERLAAYAREVAERFPWVTDWTPVNEPLTTARFSCLYGFWYPHTRDAASFAQALLVQCRAVVLAMRAIREIVPDARLIQTDDLGKTHSTPGLRYQAEHENERRWVTWDLLCGRQSGIDEWFELVGIPEPERRWFEDNPCPPDVIGVNHYLSSERFLDERLDRYPEHLHGSNGQDPYVDELAARVLGAGPAGPAELLREAWDRYRVPLAVTEAHNGCTREEQLRWLDEVWRAAHDVRAHGADVRAVTLWSLLGADGWDTLLTGGGTYEPGVFDVRSAPPRPTAVAAMARALATEGGYDHPVLCAPGWWRRPERLWYPPEGAVARAPRTAAPPLAITGATGTLGRALARVCELRGLPYRLLSRAQLEVSDGEAARAVLDAVRPWAVVNAAGYVRVDDAENDVERSRAANALGPALLAAAAAERELPFVTFSSDLVFDGAKRTPYVEHDEPHPLNVYGRAKLEGERLVLAAHSRALVVRTSAFFGPWDEWNFAQLALRELAAGRSFAASHDMVSPTYVPDLVNASLDLLIDGESGIWHLTNVGAISWLEFARALGTAASVNTCTLRVETRATTAARPAYSALGSVRGELLPPLENAIGRFVSERRARALDAAPARARSRAA